VAATPERMASQPQEIVLAGVSVLVALAGMALAYVFYVVRPQFPAQWANRFRLLYNTLYNKYYVDQVYDAAIVHPIERISESFLWKGMDVSTIDGAVNGVASILQAGADLFKRMHSGYARAYGTWILFGAFLVLLYLVGR
jgi:NADH-quinone oxidoreductase subunit L